MKAQGVHSYEDRLLDFAYGELPSSEARLVEQHLQDCARCAETLDGIRGVRTTMSRLSLESAPEAGLDSLLAYAQQSARRVAAGPAPAPRWWRRWLLPTISVAAVSVFGIIVLQVDHQVDLRPSVEKASAQEEQVLREPPPAVAAAPSAPAEAAPSVEEMHARIDAAVRDSQEPLKPVRRERGSAPAWAGSGGGFPKKKKTYAAADSDQGPAAKAPAPASKALASEFAPARQEAPAAPPPPVAQSAGAAPEASLAEDGELPSRKGENISLGLGMKELQRKEDISLGLGTKEVQRKASSRRPSPAELSREAEEARREGNTTREASLLRAALAAGVSGPQRLEVLSRLCEAEFSLGNHPLAIDICKRVMVEGPGSKEALLAQRRLESALRAQEAEVPPAR